MLRRRTSPHSGANTGPGRSQLLSQAFQASNRASFSKPGSSLQATGTQRLLPRARAAASAPDPGRAGTLAAAGAEGRGAGTGAVAQDTRPSTAAIMTSVGVIREKTVMALLLLEALF